MLVAPRSRCKAWISCPMTSTSSMRPARCRMPSSSSCLARKTRLETDRDMAGAAGGRASLIVPALAVPVAVFWVPGDIATRGHYPGSGRTETGVVMWWSFSGSAGEWACEPLMGRCQASGAVVRPLLSRGCLFGTVWIRGRSAQADLHEAALDAHRVGAHREFGLLDALAALQVDVLLVQRRGHDDAIPQAAHQPAREHAGAGLGVDVVDGEEAVWADAEDRDVAALDQGADAGVGQDVVGRADVGPGGGGGGGGRHGGGEDGAHGRAPPAQAVSVVAASRSSGRAGRIWPRSFTNRMRSSLASLLTKERKRLRTSGLVTAVFHSHW